MQKRILITGGAGFIGSHLCKKLLEDGDFVICLDNLFTGRKENIIDLMENPNFQFIEHDVTEPFYIQADQIYNLACPASPIHYQYDAIKTMKTSFMGALHVLELAKECNARILQASTSEVYGDPQFHPQSESYWGNVNPIGIRSCYDEGKRAAETLFFDYHRAHNIDIRIIRIFNTYGPNMSINDGRVVSNFIIQALRNEPVTIYGDGNQTRSFCYISDLVDGMIKIMNCNDPEAVGPTNIGTSVEKTMNELAQKIITLTNSKSEIVYKELPLDDPIQRKPDLTQIENLISWGNNIDLDTGLIKTIDYFKRELIGDLHEKREHFI